MFEPQAKEQPQESLIDGIAEALANNIDQTRESRHNVIFAAIAIRALKDHADFATPSVTDGIRKLIAGFDDSKPGSGYYGKQRGRIDGREVHLPEAEALPLYTTLMLAHKLSKGGTNASEMSRSGALYTAFALGISNMRRRALRTSLTLITITLLTFTVLSFTSFIPSLRVLSTPSDWEPAYPGMLLQDAYWWPWDYPSIDYVRSHFGDSATVVRCTSA